MEFDILDSLDDLGYSGVLKSDYDISKAIEKGVKSLGFTELVGWLSKELQALYSLDSCVNILTDVEDSSLFSLEISSFLKELNCPYKKLLDGPISQRLLDVESRRILLDYLCSELQTARLLHCKTKGINASTTKEESHCPAIIQDAVNALDIKTSFTCDPISCVAEIEEKVKQAVESELKIVTPSILTEELNAEQWDSLSSLYHDFYSEYTIRRKMLLTRLDVTIQSFKWGEGSKGKEKKILEKYMPQRNKLKLEPSVKLYDIIAARESLLVLEKTSSAELVRNTKSSLNRILIPAVPDRGGRPKEQRPPLEMPNWMKRTPGGGQGDHHRGKQWNKGKKLRGNQDGRGKKKGGGAFDAAGHYT